MGKSLTELFNGENMQQRTKLKNNCVYEKISQGVVCPCPGGKYMYVTIISSHLLSCNRLANQSQISCGTSWEGGKKVYINGSGHMTRMADMPIYRENLLLQN